MWLQLWTIRHFIALLAHPTVITVHRFPGHSPRTATPTSLSPTPAGPPEDDEAPSGVDYHSLARQHAISSSVEEGPASPAKAKAPYRPLVIRASSTIFQACGGGCKGGGPQGGTAEGHVRVINCCPGGHCTRTPHMQPAGTHACVLAGLGVAACAAGLAPALVKTTTPVCVPLTSPALPQT